MVLTIGKQSGVTGFSYKRLASLPCLAHPCHSSRMLVLHGRSFG